jgi:hypothetical protein
MLERGARKGLKVATFYQWVDALDMEIKIVNRAGEGKAEDVVKEQDSKPILPLRRFTPSRIRAQSALLPPNISGFPRVFPGGIVALSPHFGQ